MVEATKNKRFKPLALEYLKGDRVLEIDIDVKKFFSQKNLTLLQKKAAEENKPLEIVVLELCNFLMDQKILAEVIQQYVRGNESPDITDLVHKYKVEFIKLRKQERKKV